MNLSNGDLINTVLPKISIDDFEPKIGNTEEVIVVAFYVIDKDPANDLSNFIERGFVDVIDVDVSPNPDEEGHYLVFAEIERSIGFLRKFKDIITDIENLTGEMDWKIKPYLADGLEFDIEDPAWTHYIILKPEEYVSKDEFYSNKDIAESISQHMPNLPFKLTKEGMEINNSFFGFKGFSEEVPAEIINEGIDFSAYETRSLGLTVGADFIVTTTKNHIVVESKFNNKKIFLKRYLNK